MKNKFLWVLKLLLVALSLGSIALYVVSIVVFDHSPWDFIALVIFVPLISIIVILKIFFDERKENLSRAEEKYIKDIGSAFAGDEKKKKKLLLAIYRFSRKQNKMSLKLLKNLKLKCERTTEHGVVELFCALNYTAMQQNKKAIQVYENAAEKGYANSGMYNNLGHLYAREVRHELAHKNYKMAIFYDPANVAAYHNMAQLCFKQYDYKKASEYSKKALEINNKFKPSITLLAIIDSIENKKDFDESYEEVIQMTAEFDAVKIDKEK